MRISRSTAGAFAVIVALSTLAGMVPMGNNLTTHVSAPMGMPAKAAHGPTLLSTPPAGPTPGVHIRPSMLLCTTVPPWPVWAPVGVGTAPTPFIPMETGCPLYANQDEVHASYLSSVSGSGQQFIESIHLPKNATQLDSYSAVYLGMVLQGNPLSQWGQSYAELSFIPVNASRMGNAMGYNITLDIYSLVNGTDPGITNNCSGKATPGANALTWNSSWYCEESDFASGSGFQITSSPIPAGSWFNVTFSGRPKTAAAVIWANDTTNPSRSFNYTLNYSLTGTHNFTPAYNTACQGCTLKWGMGFANGIGIGICPTTSIWLACNSYDVYPWVDDPPVEFGIPQFWTGSAYVGDFQYIGFESSSGACSYVPGNINNPAVAICIGQTQGTGTGYYPYFTYNGSVMDFGAAFPWTTWDFGGPSVQFNIAGTMTAKVPLALDSIADNSRGGYVSGGQGFTVTARLQVVGHLQNASLIYKLDNGSWTSLPMVQVNGSSSIGYFNATIPGTGPNGTLSYWVYGKDQAGLNSTSQPNIVLRGPLPHFTVTLATVPAFCGTITLNGTAYQNGGVASIWPGTYSLSETGCYPYDSPVYTYSHLLSVRNGATQLVVRGQGTLTLSFTFRPPDLKISIATAPSGCGSLTIGSTAYTTGNTATLVWNRTYSLSYSACANTVFSGYSETGSVNVTVGPSSSFILATSNGSLTVHFADQATAIPLLFTIAPGDCNGAVQFWGTNYLNDTIIAVASGTYPIAPTPCAKYGFLKWIVAGGAAISGGNVTISSQATITEIQYHLTIVYIRTSPNNCGQIEVDGQNYSDGAQLVVANNSTHVVYSHPCVGSYLLGFTATGGLHLLGNTLTANGSGDLEMATTYTSPTNFVGFQTNPAYCGSIGFEGQTYYDTNYTEVSTGTVATLTATPCNSYGFLAWQAAGPGVQIVGNVAYINSSGSITAVFSGLVTVFLNTNPSTCGAIVLGASTYPGNSSPTFPAGITLPISTVACPGWQFGYWVHTPGAQITGSSVLIQAAAYIQAVFLRVSYNVQVIVNPSTCGSVLVNATPAYNGSTIHLAQGVYSIQPRPCVGDDVVGFTVLGNVSVVGNSLYVNGSGSVTVLLQPIPPSITLSVPDSAAVGLAVGFGVTVGVPIPPYNYTYNWSFGDGGAETTTANFTEHTYDTPGNYHVQLTVYDPLGRVATGNGSIRVSSVSGTAAITTALPALLALGLAGVVIAVAFFLSGRRGGGSAPEPSERVVGYQSTDARGSQGQPPEGSEAEPFPKEP